MADSEPVTKPKQYGDIPAELSFEEVIQNRAASPCSLSDFMDYLFYVEHNAEPLQFFLWYWDYIQRWSNLLPRQKALSPSWDPEQAAEPQSRFIKYSHKRERSQKMNKILAIMEMDSERESLDYSSPEDHSRSASIITSPLSSPAAILSPTTSVKPPDWQPFTIQPYRDEVCRITRHYICPTAPRRLQLSPKDREACLRAVQHTTHPTALLPAFLTAHAALRARSHPSFLRHTRRNANRARLRGVLALGFALVTLGFALDLVLMLSRRGAHWRVVCVMLWWPGLAVLAAAARGVCVLLWCGGGRGRWVRQVRPWEAVESEVGDGGGGGDGEGREGEEGKGEGVGGGKVGGGGGGGVDGRQGWREHKRTETSSSTASMVSSASSTASRVDPLRKPSLQVFGPANEYAGEAWRAEYEAKGVVNRVFDETVVVQNKALKMWQDRTIFVALLWGGAGAAALTVVSLFVPSGRLYW
ncbi:uncharacterized protein B0H64DRAFT_476820 [Chaetomium fimeti]|uniref:RGS domain-containing protein n=1 Tax=Chaetomium fimeti TaxID=1854472 RepID=A0AAE0HB04_9PEZI|nr:hypothetical protein B0H64DRAFT_476820 [Chaetomium fimeti]